MLGRRNSLKAPILNGTEWLPWALSEDKVMGKHNQGTVLLYRLELGEGWRERTEGKVNCSTHYTPCLFVL